MREDIIYVRLGEHEYKVAFDRSGVRVDGSPVPIELLPTSHKALVKACIRERILDLALDVTNDGIRVLFDGQEYSAKVEDQRQRMLRSIGGGAKEHGAALSLKAPMPGLVVKIEVKVGDEVKRGQGIVVVEAMKMENEVRAPGNGTVKEIRVKERQVVEKGEVLVVLE